MPVSYTNGWFAILCEFPKAQSSITIHQSVWYRGTNHLNTVRVNTHEYQYIYTAQIVWNSRVPQRGKGEAQM